MCARIQISCIKRRKGTKKEGEGMEYELREWRMSDAADLAAAITGAG